MPDITLQQVADAIESLDDCARMTIGVDASGPRETLYRFLEQCKATPSPAPAQPAWQPIETAPKDGRTLLLWESGSSVPVVAAWRDGRRAGWSASQEHYNTDGDACVVDTLWQDGITHWMAFEAPVTGDKP